MSYLILKKIKPRTGKKKKRPKIKLSFVYKFFFFKKRSPGQLPTPALTRFIFSEKSNLRLALVIGPYFRQKQIILIKYVTYLYYKNDHSSTQIGLLTPHGIFQLFAQYPSLSDRMHFSLTLPSDFFIPLSIKMFKIKEKYNILANNSNKVNF